MARTKATRRRRGPSYELYRVRKITWVSGEDNYSVLWQINTRSLESCSNIEGGAGDDRLDPLIWQYAKAHPNIEVFLNIERIRKNPDDPNLFSVCILHTVEGSAEDCPRSAIGYLGDEFLDSVPTGNFIDPLGCSRQVSVQLNSVRHESPFRLIDSSHGSNQLDGIPVDESSSFFCISSVIKKYFFRKYLWCLQRIIPRSE